MKKLIPIFALAAFVAIIGCGSDTPPDTAVSATSSENLPVFTLATSEYPSWSTYLVAGKAGLINGAKGGEYGPLEKKYGIDIVVDAMDYDPCITKYASGTVDAVAITNIDVLNPALSQGSTAICPTSTSVGGDKIIAVGYSSLESTKDTSVFGLDKSVSKYEWYRALELKGQNPADYKFESLDPAAAATAIQTGSDRIKAICVWNPFAMETLRKNPNSKVLADSSEIPEEIIDMIVVSNASLAKEGGEQFAKLLCDVYYQVNERLNSKEQSVADATLTALGKDFSNLSLEDMRKVVKDTRFYATADAGTKLFESQKFQKTMTDTVVPTCKKIEILEGKEPTIGYNDPSKQLNFTTKYMTAVK